MSASGSPSPFNYQVQVLECADCGTPVMGPAGGGQLRCEHCGTSQVITLRPGRVVTHQVPDESSPERLSWLREELADETKLNPFDTVGNWIPELAHLRGRRIRGRDDYLRHLLPELRKHWKRARERLPDAFDDTEAQYRVFWLAMRLSGGYALLGGEPSDPGAGVAWHLRRRAVLETAHTMLGATRYAQVLRCELTRAAVRAGEVEAARAWLGQCDPEPGLAAVDSEYRLARASVMVAEKDAEGVLKVLGPDLSTVPLACESGRILGALLRAHALELRGDEPGARGLLREAMRRYGPRPVLTRLAGSGLAPGLYAREKRAGARLRWGGLLVVLVLLGVAAWQLATWG